MADRDFDQGLAGAILETITQPLLALDADLRVEVANRAFLHEFQVTHDETVGRPLDQLCGGRWDIPELRRRLSGLLDGEREIKGYRVELTFEGSGRRVLLANANRIRREHAKDFIVLAISDVTEAEKLRLELEGRIEFDEALIDSVREALLILHRDLRVHSANQSFYELFQMRREETEGRLLYELGNGQWNIPRLRRLLEEVLPRQQAFDDYEVEQEFENLGRRVMLLNARRLDHKNLIVLAIRDVTGQRETEQRRQQGEALQQLRIDLGDRLHLLSNPADVAAAACEVLGRHLTAGRVSYVEIDQDVEHAIFEEPASVENPKGRRSRHRLLDFGPGLVDDLKRGSTIVIGDVSRDVRTSAPEALASFERVSVAAILDVPLIKNGRLAAVLVVHATEPRDWSSADVALAEEMAERTWAAVARAYAETQRRESEARLTAILEHVPVGVGLVDTDGRFVVRNPAMQRLMGETVPSRDTTRPWRAFGKDGRQLEPAEYPTALSLRGETATSTDFLTEIDSADRWVEVAAAPFRGDARSAGAVVVAEDITERKRQEAEITLLLREVNHRSKNLLGLVVAIARQTAGSDYADFSDRFEERLHSLMASQDVLVRNEWKGADLEALARSQLAHFGDVMGSRIALEGPVVIVSAEAAQTIGMALHELATNASKYGALSVPEGRIEIRWRLEHQGERHDFQMTWTEHNGPPIASPAKAGFGSAIIKDMVQMNLEADVELSYPFRGVFWRLRCNAGAILENAPARTGKPRYTAQGREPSQEFSILVVEDEALLAFEMADVLSKQGWNVIGPAHSIDQALEMLDNFSCDAAVLDVRLGTGTSEAIATRLASQDTPFVVVTGYSREQQPAAFRNAPMLTKPLRGALLVQEIKRCLEAAHLQ